MYKYGMFTLVIAAFLVGIIAFLTEVPSPKSAASTANKSTMPQVTMDASAAQTVYKSSCIACHGDQLQGKVGPSLQKVGTKLTVDQIYKQIQNGGGVMPAFKTQLSDKQIANLAEWLESHK